MFTVRSETTVRSMPVAVIGSEFVPELGLIDKLEQIDSVDAANLEYAVPLLELVKFSHEAGREWSEDTARILRHEKTYTESIEEGALTRIWNRLRGRRQIHVEECERYLPISTIHRPKVEGCETEFDLTIERETDYSFVVNLLGFGGGSGGSRAIGMTSRVRADDLCQQYEVPVRLRIHVYEIDGPAHIVRCDIIAIEDGHQVIDIPEGEDGCGGSALLGKSYRYRHAGAGGSFTESFEVAIGTKSELNFGFKVSLPLVGDTELGIKGSATTLKKTAFSYDLAGRHDYTGYQLPGSIGLQWQWS